MEEAKVVPMKDLIVDPPKKDKESEKLVKEMRILVDSLLPQVQPNPSCTKHGCNGRGYWGWDSETHVPHICKCLAKSARGLLMKELPKMKVSLYVVESMLLAAWVAKNAKPPQLSEKESAK